MVVWKQIYLEPADPETTQENQNTRIPADTYNLEAYSSAAFPDVMRLHNDQIPRRRRILDFQDTSGCSLPGEDWLSNQLIISREDGNVLKDNNGNDVRDNFITSSQTTRRRIKDYVESKGYDNVQRIIHDVIPQIEEPDTPPSTEAERRDHLEDPPEHGLHPRIRQLERLREAIHGHDYVIDTQEYDNDHNQEAYRAEADECLNE